MSECTLKKPLRFRQIKFRTKVKESDVNWLAENSKAVIVNETEFDKELNKIWHYSHLKVSRNSLEIKNNDYIVIFSDIDVRFYNQKEFNNLFTIIND